MRLGGLRVYHAGVARRDHQRRKPPNDEAAAFPATRWSLVGRAGQADAVGQPVAMAEIARMYAPALRAHLLQSLYYDEHRADDLLQGFLANKVLEQRLIDHADPTRGRFRTFLLAALDRYVVDQHRHDTARKRAPRGSVADIDQHRDTLAAPRPAGARTDAFDLVWAREVISEVLATMCHQCQQTNRADLWDVFNVRCAKPATDNVEPEAYEAIARRLSLDSSEQAANLMITAKRMFTRVFKSVVSRYAADNDEVREEVSELWRIFSSARR